MADAATSNPPIDAEALQPLLYRCGLCLHAAQTLEYGLKLLVWQLSRSGLPGTTPDAATELIEGRDKKTMGAILALLRKNRRFDTETENTLSEALNARNRFVHHFLVDNTEAIADPKQRNRVVAEAKAIRRTLLAGNRVVSALVDESIRMEGIDPNQLKQIFEAEIRAMNGEGP